MKEKKEEEEEKIANHQKIKLGFRKYQEINIK